MKAELMRIFAQVKAGEMNHDECSDAIDSILSPLPKVNGNWDEVEKRISETHNTNLFRDWHDVIAYLKQHYSAPVSPSDAIEFAEWLLRECSTTTDGCAHSFKKHFQDSSKILTPTDLYSLFTEERKQK